MRISDWSSDVCSSDLSARDIYGVDITEGPQGFVVQADIASACLNQLKLRRRSLAGRTGCGLCGIESLDEVRRDLPALATPQGKFSAAAISRAVDQLRSLRSEEHTSELQSLMRISYAVFCL